MLSFWEAPKKLTDQYFMRLFTGPKPLIWLPKFHIFRVIIIGNLNNPPTFKGDIQEIEQENQNKAGNKHGNGTKDP